MSTDPDPNGASTPELGDERIAQLLEAKLETPHLDYKREVDLTERGDVVELAKDVGAMSVEGGHLIIGADDEGSLTGDMDSRDLGPFDSANLKQKLGKYVDARIFVRCTEIEGHAVVAMRISPHPDGCVFFKVDGQYQGKNGKLEKAFQEGDVFHRDGTRSVRIGQEGLRRIIDQQIAKSKDSWIREQQQIRSEELRGLQAQTELQGLAGAALGTVNVELPDEELQGAVLELLRRGDSVALKHLLKDAVAKAESHLKAVDEPGLADVFDKVAQLGILALEYDDLVWFDRIVEVFVRIYDASLTADIVRYGETVRDAPEPRIWLALIARVYALGAYAIRTKEWRAIPALTLQVPAQLADNGDRRNWLRYTSVLTSRAGVIESGLIWPTLQMTKENEFLHPDIPNAEDDLLLTSFAAFDFLAGVVSLAGGGPGRTPSGVHPDFARFRQQRIQPTADRLVRDPEMRSDLGITDDAVLAEALLELGKDAQRTGWQYDGFEGWADTAVGDFILENRGPAAEE